MSDIPTTVIRALEAFKEKVEKEPAAAGLRLSWRVVPVIYPPCYVLQVRGMEDADSGGLWQCYVDEDGKRVCGAATYQDFNYSCAGRVAPAVSVKGL